MSLKQRIKDTIPTQVDDRIIDEVVEATESLRDGAANAGVKARNIMDEAMATLTDAIPGETDDELYAKLRNMLGANDATENTVDQQNNPDLP